MDHTRDPCPWVILNDFGGAFCMGVRIPRAVLAIGMGVAPSTSRAIIHLVGAARLDLD
jgi:hypothetical protein